MAKVNLSAVRAAVNESGIAEADKAAILETVQAAATPLPDTWVYRIIVFALGLAIFVPVVALIRGGTETAAQDAMKLLLPIATGALGALAGLLAPPPAGN